jgi:hypothetical protein
MKNKANAVLCSMSARTVDCSVLKVEHNKVLRRLHALFFYILMLSLALNRPLHAEICRSQQTFEARIAQIHKGDIVLEDGRIIHPAMLALPQNHDAILSEWFKKTISTREAVTIHVWNITPDRWGRYAGDVSRTVIDTKTRLHHDLVKEGSALFKPQAHIPLLCLHELKELETHARRAGTGLWAQASYPLKADQHEALKAHAGQFIVMEGRIHGVGVRKTMTYLNFGVYQSQAPTVMMDAKLWKQLEEQGLNRKRLAGAQVRVRGVVDLRGERVMIELHHPEAIDIME